MSGPGIAPISDPPPVPVMSARNDAESACPGPFYGTAENHDRLLPELSPTTSHPIGVQGEDMEGDDNFGKVGNMHVRLKTLSTAIHFPTSSVVNRRKTSRKHVNNIGQIKPNDDLQRDRPVTSNYPPDKNTVHDQPDADTDFLAGFKSTVTDNSIAGYVSRRGPTVSNVKSFEIKRNASVFVRLNVWRTRILR